MVTAYVLLDIFLIVVLARLLGSLMEKIGQPRVVGEIIAGILLGPTLLGSLSLVIAPAQARPIMGNVATVALIMFMFLAGVEFDASRVKGRVGQASLLAILSVAVPAALGFLVALVMHNDSFTGPAGDDFVAFALFIGASISVTAFPVMAHILMMRGELNSQMGSLGVATTAIMSILMFTYIALAGALASGAGPIAAVRQIVYIIIFAVVSWFVVRPLVGRWLAGASDAEGRPTGNGMAILFGGMVLYGLVGHLIGINALVGGFAWGLVLPADRRMREAISARVRDVAMVFLLPIFFAQAGFATDLKLLTPAALPALLVFLAASVAAKFVAAAPARAFGLSWRDVGVLGALLNTRGLLVLVAGLIGLQLEIINQLSFTVIVIMALVSNLMTLPLLKRFGAPRPAAGLAAATD
jgi:Kef-type K+ transport system membrane component KefB